jgi:hypothetical protein
MRRVDLVSATLEGWARLDDRQRERFFKAGLKAALRLDRLEFRAWLLRRLRHKPLVAVDPARFEISDDMAMLLKALPFKPDDADGGTGIGAKQTSRPKPRLPDLPQQSSKFPSLDDYKLL